jgi:hypothetical protein
VSPYASINDDGAVMEINTTFVFYSNKFHNETAEESSVEDDDENDESNPLLPEDAAFIYKDDRNYGKKSLFKHNNGSNNYTLHEIDFKSKSLGKDLGITFNKEINMSGNNDLINVIKAALKDSRMGLTSDTSTSANAKLCQIAVDRGLIDPHTCNLRKLSKKHREIFGREKKEKTKTKTETDTQVENQSYPSKSKIVFAKGGGIKKLPNTQTQTQIEDGKLINFDDCSVSSDDSEEPDLAKKMKLEFEEPRNKVVENIIIKSDDIVGAEIIEDYFDRETESKSEPTTQVVCDYDIIRNKIQTIITKLQTILDGSNDKLLSVSEISLLESSLQF